MSAEKLFHDTNLEDIKAYGVYPSVKQTEPKTLVYDFREVQEHIQKKLSEKRAEMGITL